MRAPRPLGNPIDKAWLLGWDAGVCGLAANPYKRKSQRDAFDRGRAAGYRSNDEDVKQMQRRCRSALSN